jgi:MoaA/NifB/PqqE/SkfB family radical SAM enzyme
MPNRRRRKERERERERVVWRGGGARRINKDFCETMERENKKVYIEGLVTNGEEEMIEKNGERKRETERVRQRE